MGISIMRPAISNPQAIPSRRDSSSVRTKQDYKTQAGRKGMSKGRGASSKEADSGQHIQVAGGRSEEEQAEAQDGVELGPKTICGGSNNCAGRGAGETAGPHGQLGRLLAELG
jgi:hypothetical protein